MLRRLRRQVAARKPRPAGASAVADERELLRLARLSFVQVQAAWDRADLQALGSVASAPLLHDLQQQLAQRGTHHHHTEVLQLQARLLAQEELHDARLVSVEFSGLIREQQDQAAAPFRELWFLTKLKAAGRGWQLARVQSLA